ncbi:NAD(P)/FAD-dependent oxidoreductase [Microbacterium lacticum]|uniref:NADH dehydrogenase n=1 Tax=Microbacterium lacticum TaxID=33885 RepID=A0A4Y3UHE2_9MICO|nr:FAD-dependent oxidoreductase [Microbacterium lacticum]TQN00922.1 NADH dehydrogenase [Microbacterium lacticum]GEB94351.1 dehydrogenase [Microbacterium lacticum]GGN17126.1 dehydrogenase [Microbacterium lacticum]
MTHTASSTADRTVGATAPKILVVGGGYAGFYTAWKLEKHLRKGEAEVTIVDPLPYMTYQPFLPEVAAGEIEARHAVVGLRRHLKKTRVITAKVTGIDHAHRTATITPQVGEPWQESYDQIVVTAGAVSRTFPIPGIADNAIGLKTIEEAVAIRDRILSNFDRAANLPAGPERDRLLTVVVVGGGFAGIEVFAEMRALASSLLKDYPELRFEDTHFHLIEAMSRIMPEVSLKTSEWVLKDLAKRGANVHLDTQVTGAIDGNVELSTGEVIPTDLIVWTAGVMANPTVVRGGDLPVEERGRIRTRADLRVGSEEEAVADAWAAGDVAAVPDLTGKGVGGYCVPNAQHAVRQAKLLAKNIVADLRGELPHQYIHHNLGAVAGLGLYNGVFQSGKIALKGFIAWCAHRGYHGLAMPSWERKWRVIGDWWHNFWLHRDNVSLEAVQNPRHVFQEFAARPRPAAPEAAPAAPVAAAPAAASPAIDPKSVVGENAPVAGEKADDAAPVETETPAKKAPAKKVPAKKAPAKAKSQA